MYRMEHKTGPKEVFLHLLTIVTLYASAASFLVLLFQYVNLFIPDVLEAGMYAGESAEAGVRWSLATLVVVFPLYIFVTWILGKRSQSDHSFREMRIRKWLVYFTLFAAALILAGDVVALIFRFLEGELTQRFILKVLSVFFVAGSVFGYYLWDMREEKSLRGKAFMRYASGVVVGFVTIAVVAGFVVAGSPYERRLRRFDERRTADLQSLEWQIVEYWRGKSSVPSSLDLLSDDLRGVKVPRDPETGSDYGYYVKGDLVFSLCANFRYPSNGGTVPSAQYYDLSVANPAGFDSWTHDAGNICFERTIDPDFFTINKPPLR